MEVYLRATQKNTHVTQDLDDEFTQLWRVGPGYISLEDIIIFSLHHVAMESWQPQLRLKGPLVPRPPDTHG